jgi:hypothetical protein
MLSQVVAYVRVSSGELNPDRQTVTKATVSGGNPCARVL